MARIAFIDVTATVSYGGVQTAIWQLARVLHDCGHEISVIGGEGPIRPDLEGRNIHVHTFPFRSRDAVIDLGSRFRKMGERVSFALAAKKHVNASRYDWIILTKPFDFFWPRIMGKGLNTRFAFMSGGTDFFTGDRWLGAKVDRWMACSHFNAWQIQQRYGRFPSVIFNGVDTARFAPRDTGGEVRATLGIGQDEVLFGFAGRLVGWKGLDTALRALARPKLDTPGIKFLIVGAGPHEKKLRVLSKELGLDSRVIFYGPAPHHDLPLIYSSIDVGLFPSIADEAFGITIAEAMSCGKPVIASYIGGIPEVVGNEGSAGILAPPGDDAAWCETMSALANDAPRCALMGTAARERIERQFTWQMSAERLMKWLGIDATGVY